VSPEASGAVTPPAPPRPTTFGLIAAGGRFPVLVAESARRRGIHLVCIGHRHITDPEVRALCGTFRYFGIGRLGAAIRYFRKHGVNEIVFAGWIRKEGLFRPWRLLRLLPDWRMVKLWYWKLRNRQDATLLAAIADEFESEGIHVTHSTKHCPELLAEEGILTKRGLSKTQAGDVRFGWRIAKALASLDVGQSVVVSEKSTIAVEGIEGTDRCIRRAGEFQRRGGLTVVKLAKDDHDMRFDIPTVGPDTIDSMAAAGGAVLAIEAGRTMIIDREAMLERANRHGMVVVSLREPPPEEPR
jgi:DUF1009 family protein